MSEADKKHLLGLFNRKGFTDGYYTRHNGTSMITYTAPDFRAGEDVFLEKIRTDYIGTKLKENIKGTVKIYQGKPAILSVTAAAACEDGNVSVLQKKRLLSVQAWCRKQKAVRSQRKRFKSKWKSLAILIFHGSLL